MNVDMIENDIALTGALARRSMVSVCCVCKKILRIQDGRGVSHGYCQEHAEEAIRRHEQYMELVHMVLDGTATLVKA
jgi:hypothetical protein